MAKLEIEGVVADPVLRTRIQRRMRRALSRLPAASTTATVAFTDVNGPKGGVDTRCALTVWLPRRSTVRVEELATTQWLAFTGAVEALEGRLRRQSEREVATRRRPKKYFVAKRLLAGESPAPDRRRQRPRAG